MSYADFRYANIDVEITDAGLRVAFDLENASGVEGAEVAQVYVSDTRSRVFREPQSLAGFAKAKLQPGAVEARRRRRGRRRPSVLGSGTGSWRLDETTLAIRVGSSSRETSGWKNRRAESRRREFEITARGDESAHEAPACYEST